jgi:hypothetical protein
MPEGRCPNARGVCCWPSQPHALRVSHGRCRSGLTPAPPKSVTEVLPPPPTVPIPAVGDACPEPSAEDTLPTSEIQLHIATNVVSRLDAVVEAMSLLVEELSLWEFILDQILSLQELLELSLVPSCVEELLDRELVTSTPSTEDIPSPPAVEGKVAEGSSVAAVDDFPEPSVVDNLLMPEIRLHITINAVSCLNAVEEARSFSVKELSLREFLLNRILFL